MDDYDLWIERISIHYHNQVLQVVLVLDIFMLDDPLSGVNTYWVSNQIPVKIVSSVTKFPPLAAFKKFP